ncbi:MAG: flagellar hook-associated protein FlgK, partial [Gammaproteobacteria bacterium]|nr:flagellar hook-associated protein FlgK [Gammaproteobacteria bacterium]
KIDISVVNESTNHLSIFIGNGQTVLNGTKAFTLEAVPNAGDPSRDIIVYNGFSQVTDMSAALRTGGELGALLEFRDSVLAETRNDLGRVAIALADTFNDQHLEGMDLNDDLGTNFFSFDDPQVLAFSGNLGTAVIDTSFIDVTALTRFDYTLEFDGTDWTLTSDSGTVSAAVVNASPADTTITFEGISLTIDGAASAPVAGDEYRIKPTIQGAASLNVLISDPLLIAAAAPIRTATSLDNLGTTTISEGSVTDVTNPNLLDTVAITFDTPASTFRSTSDVSVGGTLYAAGTAIPFTNGMTIDSNGWQADITGIPQANDVLTIQANYGGQGDNRNALAMANLQNADIMDGGNANYQEAYSSMVGRVGAQAAAADAQREAAASLLLQASDRKDSVTSVNLDEEAADLIRYQQAYEAASRVISTVQEMFDSLLAATR